MKSGFRALAMSVPALLLFTAVSSEASEADGSDSNALTIAGSR